MPGRVYLGTGGRGVWYADPEVALRVEFASFSSSINSEGQTQLDWSVFDSEQNSSFEIQLRRTGKEFLSISSVQSNGETNFLYTLPDDLEVGIYQARIKARDNDGVISYSAILNVDVLPSNSAGLLEIYPNPLGQSGEARMWLKKGEYSFDVIDILGRQVWNGGDEFLHSDRITTKSIDISSISSGNYLFRIMSEGELVKSALFVHKN